MAFVSHQPEYSRCDGETLPKLFPESVLGLMKEISGAARLLLLFTNSKERILPYINPYGVGRV